MPTTEISLKIGTRIKASRLQANITQEQLAELVGVSWSTISCLERGQHLVSIERLIEIADSLNIGLEKILCDYMQLDNLIADEDSQEIIKILALLSPKQKQFVLNNLKLISNYLF